MMCRFGNKDSTRIPFTWATVHCRQPWFLGVYDLSVWGDKVPLLPRGLQRLRSIHSIHPFIHSYISSFIHPFTHLIDPTLHILCIISLPGKCGSKLEAEWTQCLSRWVVRALWKEERDHWLHPRSYWGECFFLHWDVQNQVKSWMHWWLGQSWFLSFIVGALHGAL